MQHTLVDPFEVQFRAKQKTLHDPFELRVRSDQCKSDDEQLGSWTDECKSNDEELPVGTDHCRADDDELPVRRDLFPTKTDDEEVRVTPTEHYKTDDERLDDWEHAWREVSGVVVHLRPGGIRHESWRRGRSWCTDDQALA